MTDEFQRYRLTRQELHDLVWSEPISAIAKRVGLSDVAVAKTCSKINVPVPPRGYWAKIQAGQKISKIPLPKRQFGGSIALTLGREIPWSYSASPDPDSYEVHPPPVFDTSAEEVVNSVSDLVAKISLPKSLKTPHPQIDKLLKADDLRRQKQLAERYSFLADRLLFDSPFERRRLKILNALFSGLQRLEFSTSYNGKDPGEFYARIGDQPVKFTVDNPKINRNGWRSEDDLKRPATDLIKCEISAKPLPNGMPLIWQDTKADRVEDHLIEIVKSLIVAGELQYRIGLQENYQWRLKHKAELVEQSRRKKAEEERLAEEKRIKAEQARINKLLGDAAAFRSAADIREYVETVKTVNASYTQPVAEDVLAKWAEWALAQADRIDPVLTQAFLKTPAEGKD